MSGPSSDDSQDSPSSGPKGALRKWCFGFENGLLVLTLAGLVGIPILESILRRFNTGISGATSIVQHLTLILGMVGGAVAARDGRLLSLSTATTFLKGRWKSAAILISGACACTVSVLLCIASFILADKERELSPAVKSRPTAFIPRFALCAMRI